MIGPALVAVLCALQGASDVQAPAATDAEWVERIATAQGDDYGPTLNAAFERFMQHVDALRMDRAEVLMRAMHDRAHGGWSAESLAMVMVRQGRYDEARALLTEQLATVDDPTERAALLQARALHALGRGEDAVARRDLGAALLLGSSDAEVVLALLALSHGELERARVTSRALLARDPAPAWALRSWGLSMLPPAGDSPSE
ncbi:MAG: hypothetical protein H6831_06365 [Planctomycetes bacterium]|nr:hypothetical protein [Planctomycetota bacterium]MCB9904012.1 hypothetical protein [Planctomycetota bacterium]